VKSYQLAEKLASQTHETKLESVANVNDAALQARAGNLDEALRLYQHALDLDLTIGDDQAASQDWYAYGSFLTDAGFPARLAYACLLRSESLSRSHPAEAVPDALVAARHRIEKRLPDGGTAIRRDPEPVLKEALQLRR
jgi:tetratricopeptide (TPR) repeat protein